MGLVQIIKTLPGTVIKTTGKIVTKVKTNKPQIMLVGGTIAAFTGFALAIIESRKIDGVISANEAKVDDILLRKEEAVKSGENAVIQACDKELKQAKIEGIMKLARMLGIPCVLFAGGIALMIGGHMILLRRFGELSTAFATLQRMYERYRRLNIEEHGEECDRRYIYGIVDDVDVPVTITDENGKTKTMSSKIPVVDRNQAASMYTFEFSENFSRRCPKDPVNTIAFLRSQEVFWNTWMESNQKPVTLYMVLNELGIELDPDDPANDYIMLVGWRPNGDGDNKIDFGIMRGINQPALRQEENVVFLNFNCDGNLYHSPRYKKNGQRIC